MAPTNTGKEGENLSRIRDILFGEDLEGIEEKLSKFKQENQADFNKLSSNIDSRLEKIELLLKEKEKKTDQTQTKNVEEQKIINTELKQEIIKANTEARQEKEKFSQSIQKETKQISDSVSNLESSLKDELENLKQDLFNKIDELNKSKLDNNSLADLFTNLGEKLRTENKV